jgi:hypothetical protein
LTLANAWLFAASPTDFTGWIDRLSSTQLRLASGAELLTRSFRTSTRGLHPDLLLLDDVLNDENSGSAYQRERSWEYFVHTLLPMHPDRFVIVGTALHQADLLHRLRPRNGHLVHGFEWRRFRAITEDGRALWPDRHSFEELANLRDLEPTMFAREYQNEPRDDRSTFFPYALTQQAIVAGSRLTLLPFYQKRPSEMVVMGADLARSERIGADYTVAVVVAYDIGTYERRVIAIERLRGLDFEAQIALFTDLAVNYSVDLALIENNGFQAWLVDELRKRPGGHVFFGDATGRGKMRVDLDGIPLLKAALLQGRWIMPSGDEESLAMARIWQAELGAFGWRDGRVEGVGEHDDVVIACWFVERAIAAIERVRTREPEWELVPIEEVLPGFQRVKIGPDY